MANRRLLVVGALFLIALACSFRASGLLVTPCDREGIGSQGASRKLLAVPSHGYRPNGAAVQDQIILNSRRALLDAANPENSAASPDSAHVPIAAKKVDVNGMGINYTEQGRNHPEDHDTTSPPEMNFESEDFAVDYHSPRESNPIVDHNEPPSHGHVMDSHPENLMVDFHAPKASDLHVHHIDPPARDSVDEDEFGEDYMGPGENDPVVDHDMPPPHVATRGKEEFGVPYH